MIIVRRPPEAEGRTLMIHLLPPASAALASHFLEVVQLHQLHVKAQRCQSMDRCLHAVGCTTARRHLQQCSFVDLLRSVVILFS